MDTKRPNPYSESVQGEVVFPDEAEMLEEFGNHQEWGLSVQQFTMIHAFLRNGFRQTDAMITAGYTKNTANKSAKIVFSNKKVQAYLNAILNRYVMTDTEILVNLGQLAQGGFFSAALEYDDQGKVKTDSYGNPILNMEQADAAGMMDHIRTWRPTKAGIAIEVFDRLKAFELLMRAKGMLIEKGIQVNWEVVAKKLGMDVTVLKQRLAQKEEVFIQQLLPDDIEYDDVKHLIDPE